MSVAKNLLIHTCCAPCLAAPYYKLREAGHLVTAFWYNPNIHPLLEYQKRRDALREFSLKEGFALIEVDEYGLNQFLQNTMADISGRCSFCYTSRLEAVAKTASDKGFDAFSTTLLYSKYQKHFQIIEIANSFSALYQIPFFYEDWRTLWQEGIAISKANGMYRQQYCGCIFSEEDRYREQIPRNKTK